MMKKTIFAALSAVLLSAVSMADGKPPLDVSADIIQVDPVSEAMIATGNVVAVHAPFRMLTPAVTRGADGVYRLGKNAMFTTCTNDIGHLHWHVRGSFEFEDGDHGIVEDGFVHFWEIPVMWLPYLYLPFGGMEGLRAMPGYSGRWGAYLMTKYIYHIAGDRVEENPEGWGLDGNTRFDLRSELGIALGETLNWRLGEFGAGHFKIYYAWDSSDKYDQLGGLYDDWHHENWGSDITDRRYGMELKHIWDATERDHIRVSGAIFSDSYFHSDFVRNSLLMLENEFMGYRSNELAWEHNESWGELGLSVSGSLNEFYGGTDRLPEVYFDVNPLSLFGSWLNYEMSTRAGYLRRVPAQYGKSDAEINAFNRVPGPWADYETWRLDTYHRLTLPMKMFDVVSVVPRVAYRGTFWGAAGNECPTGWETTQDMSKNVARSILEGGITFSGRGTADIGNGWTHIVEPYVDILAQKAWYSGLDDGDRPYVFDAYDASLDWSDQFASRGRNLPYTWCGLTPGIRNAFDTVDDNGVSRRVFDIDAYVVLQCNDTTWYGDDEFHRLAEVGKPNYGEDMITPIPGFRVGWYPVKDASVTARLEYDSDSDRIALANLRWNHRISDSFNYFVSFYHADYRRWDYSSSPFDPSAMNGDEMNSVHYSYVYVGFTHELCDAIAWSPRVRWDCVENQLDSVSAWIDFRTDCLGFRFLIEYENSYTRIDGSVREEDFSVGFYIYLRAFGADSGNVFNQ